MGTSSTQISTKSIKISHLSHDGDPISNLHEDVLSHILSRLPTKDVFRTCILSRTWKYKWTSSYNVDIDDLSTPDPRRKAEVFANFVDRALGFCKHLKSFRLLFGKCYDLGRVETWISIALRHNLESLEVECGVNGIVYPYSLLNSTSLRKLDLRYGCTLNVAAKNIATNLTSLYLYRVEIVNENPNTSTVTFTFPVLKTFTVILCGWLNVKSVEIYAPLLATFRSEQGNDDVEDYDYSFVIIAPRLATFTSSLGIPEKINLDGSSIVSAKLCCEFEVDDLQLLRKIGLRVGKLLNELKNLEELTLTGLIAEVSQLGPPLRRHDKLGRLSLICPCHSGLLFHILHAAPSLKFLSMNVCGLVDDDYGVVIETVPSCIVSQLEEVEFRGSICGTPQYNLAKFLLNNGERLKKIYLNGLRRERLNEVIDILLGFPRRSPCVIIEC